MSGKSKKPVGRPTESHSSRLRPEGEPKKKYPSRRQFLGLLALLTAAGAGYVLTRADGEKPSGTGSESGKIDELPDTYLKQAEVNTLYESLEKEIRAAMKEAKETNKKLYILLGENHFDDQSLLVEMLTLQILSKLDWNNLGATLYLEMEPDEIPEIEKIIKEKPKGLQPDRANKTNAAIMSGAMGYSVKTIETKEIYDLLRESLPPNKLKEVGFGSDFMDQFHERTLDFRNGVMARRFLQDRDGGVAIVGGVHLKGMKENLEKDSSAIVKSITLSPELFDPRSDLPGENFDKAKTPKLYDASQWMQNSPHTTHIRLEKEIGPKDEPRGTTILRMLKMAEAAHRKSMLQPGEHGR